MKLPPTSSAKFTPFGDWVKATKLLGSLDTNIKTAVLKSQYKIAKIVLDTVKGHLRRQDLGWKPLNKKYKKRKQKLGRDARTLISTKVYLDNITAWNRKNGWEVFIGVKKGIFSRNISNKLNKHDVATIATYHEFSRKRKMKRPLWNPSIRELGSVRGIKKMYIDEIEKNLKRYGPYIRRLKI